MCGIAGVFNRENSVELVKNMLSSLKQRGNDYYGIAVSNSLYYEKEILKLALKLKTGKKDKNCIGHCLHSIVSFIPQPLKGKKGILTANCEIYNWKDISEKYSLNTRNDSETILKLIELKGVKNIKKVLNELNGVYAFAYLENNFLYLCRDILGIKPVWFCQVDGFSFASEKKALEKINYIEIEELNPRKILKYNVKKNKINFIEREFFKLKKTKTNKKVIKKELYKLLVEAVKRRLPEKKFGVLFSGGIDSSLIAFISKKLGYSFNCYVSAFEGRGIKESEDLIYAKKVADDLGFNLRIKKTKINEVEKYLKVIVPLIEDSNVVKAEVALTLFLACEQAKKDNCKVILSGLGSEEIFAGYQRHKKSADVNKECLSGLLKIYERDTYRDDVISMYNNLELRLPFLDKELVKFALNISPKLKLNEHDKFILREMAKNIGLLDYIAYRKKRAAQYGSNFDKAIKKLAKKNKTTRSSYLKRFYRTHNLRLGVLFSSGKDSSYALYTMLKQNYEISCLIAIKSRNPNSYMFHTPNINLVKFQAKAMDMPLVFEETTGEKEKELVDLEKAIKKAKRLYKIEGIVTGALFSSYQRDRIEKIADKLGLKVFSPLWHKNQELEMRELIKNGFEFILTSIAAYGLNKEWLGKKITEKDINKFIQLNKKFKINVAGEGGEFESLVLDAPMFKKKIRINEYEIIQEDENTAQIIVKKVNLVGKKL